MGAEIVQGGKIDDGGRIGHLIAKKQDADQKGRSVALEDANIP